MIDERERLSREGGVQGEHIGVGVGYHFAGLGRDLYTIFGLELAVFKERASVL